jgi:hypothetical protein
MFNRGLVLRVLVQARESSPIRFSSNSGLTLAALVVAVLLLPSSGWATVAKNCPVEPAQAAIVSGETYFGTNCVLKSAADLDTFTFSASAGDTWKVVAGGTNVANPNNICVTLNDPKGTTVANGCSLTNISHSGTIITKPLTVAGTYTIVVTETGNAVVDYGVSLERLNHAPADGIALALGKTISSAVSPPSAQDAYTFFGATTGTYEVSATMTSGSNPENLCFSVYQGVTIVVAEVCTETNFAFTVQSKFTPIVNGTFVVIVFAADNTYTLNYTVSVQCVAGTCPIGPPPPPTCALKDAPSYNAATGTLTMNFTVATPVVATWNGWLSSQNTVQSLWSESLPITEPSVTMTKTQANVPKSGKVGILSTLTTPTKGITCSSWAQVNTGAP